MTQETELTPSQIVAELDRHIVGQHQAKRAVAIALRNRIRRRRLPPELADNIQPKNILMIGPTGVGKTEIARRLAKIVRAPFCKVEATKFTEVGYVGRDVDAMVRDLVETAIRLVKEERMAEVQERAAQMAEERLLDLLQPPAAKGDGGKTPFDFLFNWGGPTGAGEGRQADREAGGAEDAPEAADEQRRADRQQLRRQLQAGLLEDRMIEVEIEDHPPALELLPGAGGEEISQNLQELLGNMLPRRRRKRRMMVAEARPIVTQQEAQKLIDMERVTAEAVQRAEQSGIIFLDEIDKIAGTKAGGGPDVSREGVQRDILPIVEGATVMTKYGPVKTDHILFIAAGAFHVSKPSDLIPELQGRFPIRVELESLSKEDFRRILTEPRHALIKQYQQLLQTEGVQVAFDSSGIDEIAQIASRVNQQTENIGARRLHTVLEKVLEEISFQAPDMAERSIVIDRSYVKQRLEAIVAHDDLSRYIL